MDQAPNRQFLDDIKSDITAALDWWREAGVDCDFLDEPREWIVPEEEQAEDGSRRPPRRRPQVVDEAPAAPTSIDPKLLPADLDAFRAWWMTETLLDDGGPTGRLMPEGEAGAELMIVVETPEGEDRERLLTGPQGRLLDAMLKAFGMRREDVYLASALPRPDPVPDWRAAASRGVGDALARHIALAAPKRLIVLGGNVLPLIGHESPQRAAVLRQFHHEGMTIPLLAGWGLAALLQNPRAKASIWRAWLEWTAP
ncbi:uracil-DNA glycosylase family protein [Novosphingobium sp. PhB165]|uniref:uracil-DNA glycosylase family protein n=1 Tax=Novosphingobium sp. PhB165 TaxID=2485105 RepID=UPI001052C281|nr:uracil-DNA glycosylase family protein [Novosphingobium sp. PhB165]